MTYPDIPYKDRLQLEYIQDEDYIVTTFRGESLEWDGELFLRSGYESKKFDLYKEINSYLELNTVEVSETIWNAYKRIHAAIMEEETTRRVIVTLIREMRDISRVTDYERMRKHLLLHEKIRIPSSLERTFTREQSINRKEGIVSLNAKQSSTPEKTYLYEDYVKLVAFTCWNRIFTPIWGSFVDKFKDDLGAPFKESVAGQLLSGCKAIVESEAYKKLFTYTSSITANVEKKDHVVMDGLPQVKFPEYVFNLTLVRRITIGDIRGVNVTASGTEAHLITYVHSFLDNRIRNNSDSFALRKLRDKSISSSRSQDEESKMTNMESVRISEDFSPGAIKELQFFLSLTDKIAEEISPTTPKYLIEEAMANAQKLDNQIIHTPQINMLGWILGPYSPPKSILNAEKKTLLNFLGIAQATLWHHELYDLAIILSLTEYTSRNRTMQSTARSNIPGAMIEEARELWPHHRRASGRTPSTRPEPVPVTTVKTTVNQLLERDWRLNLPEGWVIPERSRNNYNPRTREYRIPSDIRVQLMELALMIGRNECPFKLPEPDQQ